MLVSSIKQAKNDPGEIIWSQEDKEEEAKLVICP